MKRSPVLLAAMLGSASMLMPAAAQAQAKDSGQAGAVDEANEIVVIAERIRGRVDVPEPPVATFDEGDIAALGASSISDLLARISPQTGSGRGRGGAPVVLVNGQRIGNFREMRNYPPEAVRRVDVLPEEVALRFGFPPDARVINVILKDNFRNRRIEASYGLPTRGGFSVAGLEANMLRIDGPSRFNLHGEVSRTSPLFESERASLQSTAPVPDVSTDLSPADWRTLISDSRSYEVTASLTRGLGKDGLGGAFSANASASRTNTTGYSGLTSATLADPLGASAVRTLGDPLRRFTQATTLAGGLGLNSFLGSWQFSGTIDLTHGETTSLIDRRVDTSALVDAAAAGSLAIPGPLPAPADPGQDRAASTSNRLEGLATFTGKPALLPAGPVSTVVKAGFTWIGFDSSDQRTVTGPVSLTRRRVLAGVNLGMPLTSRRNRIAPAIGDLALNLNLDWANLSDFGTTLDWSAGLTWSPIEKLGLQASYIVNQSAPSISELGNPVIITANVPVYDFARNETVLVSVTSGGNPALRKEQRRDWKFGANWSLPFLANSSLLVEYFRNRSSDVTADFPILTPEIEAAFPARVERDSGGRLVAIDQRPVTFAEQTGSRLRWGLNLSGSLGKVAEGGFGGRRGGGMGAMLGGPPTGGRWSLGLYHTVQFSSRVLIAPGLPELDLLDGDALGTSGTPRHSLEFNGNAFYKWFGLFAQGSWSGPFAISGSGLRFGSLAKLDLNLFADFGRNPGLVKAMPVLRNTRASLRVSNLFDAHQRVVDANGQTPLAYQPDYLDPRGRVITFELRKSF